MLGKDPLSLFGGSDKYSPGLATMMADPTAEAGHGGRHYSDTIAAIAGSIAEVICPIPQGVRGRVIDRLDPVLRQTDQSEIIAKNEMQRCISFL